MATAIAAMMTRRSLRMSAFASMFASTRALGAGSTECRELLLDIAAAALRAQRKRLVETLMEMAECIAAISADVFVDRHYCTTSDFVSSAKFTLWRDASAS